MLGEKKGVSEQVVEHYMVEKELANRLRNSSKVERTNLYTTVYNELYQRIPYHPQLTRKISADETRRAVARQMSLLERFLSATTTFLEIGPGDLSLSREVAKSVRKVYAIDVSDYIVRNTETPANLEVVISDGSSIEVPSNCVNVAYSHQLMEHLHPADAFTQLQNVYKSLEPKGVYVCVTPNALFGPHDVSKHFDEVATGFHLKEYTVYELSNLFKSVGFSKVKMYFGGKRKYLLLPLLPFVLTERLLTMFPFSCKRHLSRMLPFRLLLDIRLVGTK